MRASTARNRVPAAGTTSTADDDGEKDDDGDEYAEGADTESKPMLTDVVSEVSTAFSR